MNKRIIIRLQQYQSSKYWKILFKMAKLMNNE